MLTLLHQYDDRVEVYYGGASSGKSHGVYQKIVLKCLKKWDIPRRVVITRKVGASLKDSSFQHVKDVLVQFKLYDYCSINKTDFTITLPNRAQLLFKGLDDPEKIKSIKGISDIVMEEATEFTLEDYTQLNIRLRDLEHKQKQIFLMFNPISKMNWVYGYFFQQDSGAKIYWSTYHDNKFLDDITRKELERLKDRNPAYYRIYALGEFSTLDKLVFPVYEKRIIPMHEVAELPIYIGLDFGYINDPSALICARYDKDNRVIYITNEYVKKGMLNNEIADTIMSLELHKEQIYADSAEIKSIDEIKKMGVQRIKPVIKGQGSIMQGIQWILQNKLVIDERCFETLTEIENYTYRKDRKTGEYINEPVDSYNHCFVGDTNITMGDGGYKKIKDIVEGDTVATSKGLRRVLRVFNNGEKRVAEYWLQSDTDDVKIKCTDNHLIKTSDGWKRISELKSGQTVYLCKNFKGKNIIYTQEKDISQNTQQRCTGLFGSIITEKYQKDSAFITSMETHGTTGLRTSRLSDLTSTYHSMGKSGSVIIPNGLKNSTLGGLNLQRGGTNRQRVESGTLNTGNDAGLVGNILQKSVKNAEKNIKQGTAELVSFVIRTVKRKAVGEQGVYDLMVDDCHEYFANGLLVHNCIDALRYALADRMRGSGEIQFI